MVDSTISLIKSWESRIESEGGVGVADIRVDKDMKSLAADVISRACFGSSYSRGQQIFSKFDSLLEVMSKGTVGIPGLRYNQTKNATYLMHILVKLARKCHHLFRIKTYDGVRSAKTH